MSHLKPLGIWAIGAYLPEEVRTNDFWPSEVVDRWRERSGNFLLMPPDLEDTPGRRAALEAINAARVDPFQGAVQRRVLAHDKEPSFMEQQAATSALQKAGLKPDDIDLLLCQTTVPDILGVNHAAILHRKLGLKASTPAMVVDSVCTSFLMQMHLAQHLLAAGTIRHALLVQSSTLTRLSKIDHVHSAWFGDGATATVVGAVKEGYGLLSVSFGTDGSYCSGPVCGVPGKRWHDEGRVTIYTQDGAVAQRMFLDLPDMARRGVDDAFAQTAVERKDVRFYACHQPLAYARPLTQSYVGLEHAKSVDIFSWTGNLGASNLPLQLSIGANEGLLCEGDIATTFTVGSGATWGGAVMRWGGRA